MAIDEDTARIPAPASISAPAQEWLTSGFLRGDLREPATVDDIDGWTAYIAAQDAALLEFLRSRIPDNLPVAREDIDVDGVPTFSFRPHHVADDPSQGIYLDIHGGGLLMGGGEVCAAMSIGTSLLRNLITWSPDYRMPPAHRYPAALDDVITVYRRALAVAGAERVIVGGASAGGNLAAALLLRARDEGLPMPAALVLQTPEVDLTESGDSFVINRQADHILSTLMTANLLYADGEDLSHPYLSPLFGDVSGFPPTLLTTGTRDLYLSNTVRMHRKLRAAGVEAELHVGEAMPHGGFGGRAPEDMELTAEVARFVEAHRKQP